MLSILGCAISLNECADYPYEPGRLGPVTAHARMGLYVLPGAISSISMPYIRQWQQHCVAAHSLILRSMRCRRVVKATCHDGHNCATRLA